MEQYIAEIKESTEEYLSRFEKVLPELIKELRVGSLNNIEMVADASEGAKWLLESALAQSLVVSEEVDRFLDALSAIEEALDASDYVLLADILEYEILEMVVAWHKGTEVEPQ